MTKYFIITIFIFFSFRNTLFSAGEADTLKTGSDTEKTEENKKIPKEYKSSKSGTIALLYTFVFPGIGQIYTEDYWKVPVFAGAAGYMIYNVAGHWKNYSDWSNETDKLSSEIDQLNETIAGYDPNEVPPDLLTKLAEKEQSYEIAKSNREFYHDNRDIGGLYLLGVYVIAAIDAYVGAQLFDFTVDENISGIWIPAAGRGIGVSCIVRF